MTHGYRCQFRLSALVMLVLGFGVATGSAQNAAQFETWKEKAPLRPLKVGCRDLRSLTTVDMSIDTATLVPAEGGVPEFCHIRGLIVPEVQFEVTLPTAWNGRLYMFGNGGFGGEALDASGRIRSRDAALKAGFAVAQTNTGHDAAREPVGTFALVPQKLIDFAYRAVHVTALSAKSIIGSYYNAPLGKSYFDGCSTGGRQGLVAAQRFPADFDGILTGAPTISTSGTYLHRAKTRRAFDEAPLPPGKVKIVAEKVYAKCDAVDGLADGIIADPRQCSFNPAQDLPVCGAAAEDTSCLTPNEIKSVEAVYGTVTSLGVRLMHAVPFGAEAFVPAAGGPPRSGWGRDGVVPEGATSSTMQRAESFFQHMVSPGTPLDWRTFDPERNRDKLRTIDALMDPSDRDLSRLRERGGKILLYHGWADSSVNPYVSADYYDSVQKLMGPSTDDFFRFFPMPGVFHCSGGPGPDLADMITPLVEWVERGRAPARIRARSDVNGKTVRTRPLCPYPQVAKYKGTGSSDDADNFVCSTP